MVSLVLLRLLSLGIVVSAFTNGPGSKLKNGGHTANYEPIIELSEALIANDLGENSTALEPPARIPSKNETGTSPIKDIFKRQDNRPAGALKCAAGQPCIDGSCCSIGGTCGFKDEHCGSGCQSNCTAKAMCGIDSKGGAEKCGLSLCCSFYGWCGTKDVHCIDPEPLIGKTPCQEGYGGCKIIPSPECGAGGSGGDFRRIAYYAGWNSRKRTCDKVFPANINTTGLTHLMYSFVGFDPKTFKIVPDPKDVSLFKQFTKLGTKELRTWVAVGGWAFNDPDPTTGALAYAYSDMVSTKENRDKFISSLIDFMDEYGFTGADIDWEYPSNPERGGRKADKDNLVELMKDMKAAFGTKYGVSVVLAPDYWYLQGFAPAAMQEYVDHLGFMAYDLHGPWDQENALGNRMRPHTDIRDIDNGLTPLWFDGVDPKKVVMGIAYYGRSFTTKSADCPVMGCEFSGPGKAYGCTNSDGVLSNVEIRRIIKETGASPFLLEGAMVKELIFDNDQWVAYDDDETIALKEAFARKRCLGGTMIWSIDYDSPSSISNPDKGTIGGPGEDGECIICTPPSPNWDPVNPMDLTSIKKLAAIGDSYSAGIGAGDRLGSVFDAFESGSDYACSRYNRAYPYLVNNDAALGDPSGRQFQFVSCSGAIAKDVLEKQIPQLDNDQDAILLSIGGNDVGLLGVLNQCIYQIGSLTKEQVAVAKLAAEVDEQYAWAKDVDWDSLGLGCEAQLQRTSSIATSQAFKTSLDNVISAAKKKLKSGGKIYYTGYGKFFAEDMTTECDKVTWTTWLYRLANFNQPAAYLTRSRRTSMNLLVDTVNQQIQAAIARAGGDVKFIDYDLILGERRGRYCESGVDESTKESNSRVGLMFYELNSWDWSGSSPWKRGTGGELQGTFMGDMNILAQIQLLADPDAKLANQHSDTSSMTADKAAVADVSIAASGASAIDMIIPDGYGRVFHPQIGLHKTIAGLILYEMSLDHQRANGYADVPEAKDCQTVITDPGKGKALNIILENKRKGVPGDKDFADVMNWLFYSVSQGTSSTCSNNPAPVTVTPATGVTQITRPPYPAGTYDVKTQDGDCQYKNDGKGNAGALWCGSTQHSCRAHPQKDTRKLCYDLAKQDGWGSIEHTPLVVCEW